MQRIVRLTPLSDVLAAIEARVAVVKPSRCRLVTALGSVLAEDVVATTVPPRPIALRDGFAVEAATIADAGPYAPVRLTASLPRVDAGDPMPSGTDAVVPLDAVTPRQDGADLTVAVVPSDGVLPAGGDAASGTVLCRAGVRVRGMTCALIAGAGIEEITVREPCIRLTFGFRPKTPEAENACSMMSYAVRNGGAKAFDYSWPPMSLEDALTEEGNHAVIVIGGAGSGCKGMGIAHLARLGSVEAHGIAISPGETSAFGFVGPRPVLVVPERLDAVLAIWLLIGRPLVAKLLGAELEDSSVTMRLKRKVTSAIGLTELVPVRCAEGMAEPLASGYLSLTSLAQSDGWIVIPADSEGFAAGTPVAVRPWP